MTIGEIVAIIVSVLSGIVSVTVILKFAHEKKHDYRKEGANENDISKSIEVIRGQNNNLIESINIIFNKLDTQNIKLHKLEQTVNDAKLSEIPIKIAEIKESVKSAQHRIDRLESKENKKN